MKQDKNEMNGRFSVKEAFLNWFGLFLVLVAAIIAFLLFTNFQHILKILQYFLGLLKPVIYGCVIAYLINPLYKTYQRWLRKPFQKKNKTISKKVEGMISGLAIALGLITGILIIAVLCWMVLPQLFSSIVSMVNNLPKQANYYYNMMTNWLKNNPYLADQLQKALLQATDYLDAKMNTELIPWLQRDLLPNVNTYAVQFASGVMSVLNVLYNLFIGIIVAIYLLGSKRQFSAQAKKIVYALFRRNYADMLVHYVQLTNEMFSGFIVGKIVDSTIIGMICFVAMWILDLPYALLVSVIVGVTNVIPVFGPYIGAIPSVFLILLIDPMQALYFLILIIVLQQVDGNIIGPAILGESTGLSAFWVLFSILLFGGLWGIIGMLIGVPLFAVIYQIIADVTNAKLRSKQLSTVTEHYLDLKEIVNTEKGIVYLPYSEEELRGKKKKREPNAFMSHLKEVWKNSVSSKKSKAEKDSDLD